MGTFKTSSKLILYQHFKHSKFIVNTNIPENRVNFEKVLRNSRNDFFQKIIKIENEKYISVNLQQSQYIFASILD